MPVQLSFSPREMGVMPAALRALTSVRKSSQVAGTLVMPALVKRSLLYHTADHAHVPRHAVVLAIFGIDSQRTGCEAGAPGAAIGIEGGGDILEHASRDLVIHDAAAPALEDIGGRAALHDGGQLGLEGFIFQNRDMDGDIGMSSHILVGQILPEGLAGIEGGNMPPFDRDRFRR